MLSLFQENFRLKTESSQSLKIDACIQELFKGFPSLTPRTSYAAYILMLYFIKRDLTSEPMPSNEVSQYALNLVRELSDPIGDAAFSLVAEQLRSYHGLDPSKFIDNVNVARRRYVQFDTSEFHQPQFLTDLAVRLLDYQGGEVYNPFAGNASYGFRLNIGHHYHGEEFEKWLWALTSVESYILGIDLPDYVCGDSFSTSDRKYRYVISTPPLAFFSNSSQMNTPKVVSFLDSRLAEDGKAVFVVPSIFLDSVWLDDVNAKIRLSAYLSAVILLPPGILNTSKINMCLVVLDHSRCYKPVRMFDASDRRYFGDADSIFSAFEQHCLEVDRDDLDVSRICTWNPGYYENVEKIAARIKAGENWVKLDKVLSTSVDLKLRPDIEQLPSIEHVQYSNGMLFLSNNPVELERSNPHNYAMSKIPVLLILRRKTRGLVADYFHASAAHPISYHRMSYIGFTFDPTVVDPLYLVHQLKKLNLNTIKQFTISSSEILREYILIPPLSEQKRVIEELNIQESDFAKRQLAQATLLQDIKEEYDRRLADKRHSLRNAFQPLMSRVVQEHMKLNRGLEVVDNRYMIDFLSMMIDDLSSFSLALAENTKDLEQFGEPQDLPFISELRKFISSSQGQEGFTKELVIDTNTFPSEHPEGLTVKVNATDFGNLINNIFSNALIHGFTDPDKHDYYFRINVSYASESDYVVFEFSNNGTPMARSIDEKVYGTPEIKVGKTGRTGMGGAYVKQFAQHYNGRFSLQNKYDDAVSITCIRVELPLNH